MHTTEWEEFVALGCTLLGQDFTSAVEAIFDVFGTEDPKKHPTLHKDLLVKLLLHISKHDSTINPQFVHAISHELSRHAHVSYREFLALQPVKEHLHK